MKIYKRAQQSPGVKKAKIVFDFATGEAKFAWVDNQFGEEGAPCTSLLDAIFGDMEGVEQKSVSTAGYSDKDTSHEQPDDEFKQPEVAPQVQHERQR